MSYVKVYKYKKQISLDNGVTWSDVTPSEYALSGEPIGYYDTSTECEYGPIKLKLILNNSNVVYIECDSTSAITSGEVATQYSGTVVSAQIGDCVTNLGVDSFRGCISLTGVTLPNSVISMGNSVFSDCISLTSCILSSGITSISDYTFYGCSGLTDVIIPDGVTSIGMYAFRNCKGFRNIVIPQNVITIGNYAFRGCSYATSITVNATIPPSIGSGVFADTNDCPIYVPCDSVDVYKSATNWSNYANRIRCKSGDKYILTLNDSTTVIAACDSTSAVTYNEIVPTYSGTVVSAQIGDCVTTIGNQAFLDCRSLKNVIIGSSITSIGYEAFYNCTHISGLTINAETPPALGAYAFLGPPLYPIYVPCDRINAYKSAWPNYADRITCKYDAKFVLTLNDSREITAACDSTSAISRNEVSTYMYSAVKAVIGDCVTTINHLAFYDCMRLTTVIIPDNVTIIGNEAFLECRNLSTITINSTIPPYIGYNSFGDSTYNYSIYVPSESVNAYKTAWPNYADRIYANPYN